MSNELGTSSTLLALPPGGAATRGLGETFQADLYTGSGVYDVALELPAAQQGFRPELALRYSTSTGNGPFGQGWDVPVLSIQRSSRKGFPLYDDTLDGFVFGDDLVPVQAGTRYRPRADTRGWRIEREGSHWTVTTKDGVVYLLGRSPNARVERPDGSAAFSWLLEETRTPTGQSARFRYLEDGGGRLVESIAYGPFRVVFEYEDRPDVSVSRRSGFPVVLRRRCREIRVESDRSVRGWLRRYRLEYAAGDGSGVSLLTRVVLEAGEGAARVAMPELGFRYGAWDPSRITVVEVAANAGAPLPRLGEATVDLVDLEGSGRPGVVQGTSAGWVYWPNQGQGEFGPARLLENVPGGLGVDRDEVRFLDLEGNGTVDLLVDAAGTAGYFPNAAGGTWETFVAYDAPLPFDLSDPELRLYDADGNGRIDAVTSGPDAFLVFTNLGREGWGGTPLRVPRVSDPSLFPDVAFSNPGVFTADMSGDGLTDLVAVRNGGVAYWPCEGVGRWGSRVAMDGAPVFPPGFDPRHVRLIDADGNGIDDLVYLGTDEVQVWFNERGTGWSGPVTIPVPGLARDDAVVVDLLGVGRPGVFWSTPDPASGRLVHRFVSFGVVPEDRMLVEASGGLGHTTRITYGTSVEHRRRDEARGRPWKTFLPFCVPVVDRVANLDAPAAVESVTSYAYHDGHFDGIERSFNGFGGVDQETEGDPATPAVIVATRFHPGADPALSEAERRQLDLDQRLAERALRGSPLQIERYERHAGDAAPRLVERTAHVLSARIDFAGAAGRVVVPFPVQATTEELGDTPQLRRAVVRHGEPDAEINPTWTEFEAGSVRADGGYERHGVRRETFDYVDPAAMAGGFWLPGLLRQRATLDAEGRVLACVRIHYDGPDFEGLANGLAERGVVTRIEELVAADGEEEPGGPGMASLGHHHLGGPGVRAPGWYRNRSRTRTAAAGQVVVVRDALGNDTAITYDAWGIDPVRTVDAAGMVTSAGYDHAVELVSSVTSASGVTEQRIYDALGRTRRVLRTGAGGSLELVAAVRHDHGNFGDGGARDRPPSITTLIPWRAGRDPGELEDEAVPLASIPEVSVTRRYYGSSGAELETVSSGPLRESGGRTPVHSGVRAFNVQGKVAREGRPRLADGFGPLPRLGPAPYERVYDGSGRELTLVFPGGRREQRFQPLRTLIADANAVAAGGGASVERGFDGLGRMVEVREHIGGAAAAVHRFGYGADDRIAAVHAPEGGVLIEYAYDRLGRRVRARHRDAGEYRYVYDALGNLVLTRHPTGSTVRFAYDAVMRLVSVEQHGAGGELEAAQRFFYDRSPDGSSAAGGRLCAIQDDAGLTLLDYAPDGRLVAKRRTTPEGKELAFGFEYDFRGLVSVVQYPDGTRVAYEHGAEGEIVRIEGFVDRIGYDERGRPTRVRYASGLESRFAYNDAERLAVIETSRGGVVVARFEQDYDGVGNPVRLYSRVEGLGEEERRLDYDALHRLVRSAGHRDGAVFEHGFRYDDAGNLLGNSEHGLAGLLYEDPLRPGLLTGIVPEGGAAERARRYDAAGRLVASETLAEVAYNAADRLVRCVTRAGEVAEMRYDAYGRRARTTVWPAGGASPAGREVFDDLYEESGDERVLYIRGIGGIMAAVRTRAGQTARESWHHDPQGNLRFTADAYGAAVSRFSYTSFGLEAGSLAAGGSYLGKLSDPGVGLIQLGSRFYEPRTGRFTTPDLFVLERPDLGLSDPSVFNLYAYSLNNPHRYRDPRGRFPVLVVVAGILIGAALGYHAARENGKDPWVGALVGGLVGGLAGATGVLGPALTGAAIGAASAWISGGSSRDLWTGAALGFAFGALGGAVSHWVPVVGGESAGARFANALIEIGSDALVGGLAGGTSTALAGRSFEDGFTSGAVMGAAFATARIAVFGVRYDPASIKQDFHGEASKEFIRQNGEDGSYLSAEVRKAGMPDPSSVRFRTGGLLHYINGNRAVTFANTVATDSDTMSELRNGGVNTLAHELRHIAQERAALFGTVEFLAVWLFEEITVGHHYERGNTTLEPYYK